MSKNKDYEDKINTMSKEFLKLSDEKDRFESLLEERERRLEELKEKYLLMGRRVEQMPEIEIKLKSVSSINVELERRISELIETN